ncbi:phage tail assembly protein [Comamonas kerstersii]|uniref:phage tail assembly protein n=1 Tax=Comamonas kerstersii TaxID=225992 RepID=UPI0020683258|nr:MAG TPA: tail assembly chaperone [Caudoviricetes sp.]
MEAQDNKTPANDNTKTVALDAPFKRGEKMVETITVRRPNVGALRGTSLAQLMMMDTDSIQKVLPRCTEPPLIKSEMEQLDPADLVQLGTAVVHFLLPKKDRQESPEA